MILLTYGNGDGWGGELTTVRWSRWIFVIVTVTSGASSAMGRSLVGAVDYDDAPRVVVLARQASRWLSGGLA
jgi:hypothetical protein